MNTFRPLSDTDLRTLAAYLQGTNANIGIALSELGFDPWEYPEIRRWLNDIGFILTDTWHWETDE
jgi:hypothetical protein